MSSAVLSFLGDPDEPFVHLPVSLPLPELVQRINAAQPVLLRGYPSVIDLLTAEARAGRLRISPRYVETGAEILSERTRRQVREIWGVGIDDCWALTEGITAVTCQGSAAMHLPDDFVIVEPVDEQGVVVPPGMPAASFLLTSLYRVAQPLIRYRVEDSLTLLAGPCACGSAHRRIADLVGRKDVLFDYGPNVLVHAYYLGLILDRDPAIRQFQVRQTRHGVILRLLTVAGEPTDASELAVRDLLAGAGLANPAVEVDRVEAIERLPSGKLQRYVPLASTGAEPPIRSDPV
jgi:phenylacetate-coenzyme A ligase PaaK-like adenylate-forming protein